ncbi:glycine--tRNA ligase subunit beta [uncultured Anaerococcus sp.]|uniref:glycine--tRNA ligase subunit beta n=1 Tax=uncultured Anaerococcus sp. TaxID=293428 RepID=UPI00280B880B|nr:glycine--tRNA ligase subunit beta [uncultured Anaerococcus sp.]MDU5149829.1 glycine--tRNA ligase subunit beta [Anaerococcus prevotii]
MSNYLLEIGVEEIPSDYVKNTKNQLKEKFEKLITENKLTCDEIVVESTPRRFAIFLENINADTEEKTISVKGPSVKIAYDEGGEPKKPLLGFLKGQGAEISDVVIREFKGEDYIYVEKKEKAKSVAEVLEENVYDLVKSISFPRSMRWRGKSIRWARPIRWFVSLLDDEILAFDAEDISVSNITKGHRSLGSNHIVVERIENYEKLLRENYVILRYKDRKDLILRGLNRLSSEVGGEYMKDADLLDEVINIVEYPTVLIGDIDKKYLELPKEVITTPMKDHQRYFPVEDENKNLLPYFLLVRNGNDTHSENVVEGNKKVLVARLEDAKFFYDIDMKKPLDAYVDDLENLAFFEGLGDMKLKTKRLERLAENYRLALDIGDDMAHPIGRAAYLSKADLVTKMVVEFTELQGTMGRIYAEKSGEEERISTAIEEAYMPRSAGDKLPKTITGIVLSIADKMDTIVGLYAIEKYVTGSQDPFGLRRACLGIINIFLENSIDVDLRKLIGDALLIYTEENELSFDYDLAMEKTLDFFRDRLRNKLIDDGHKYDTVNAVLKDGELNILKLTKKVEALDKFLEENEDQISYFTRIVNLSDANMGEEVNKDLLEGDLEKDFFAEVNALGEYKESSETDYLKELENIKMTSEVGNNYLDNTMINVEDEDLKANRIAMLNILARRIKEIFDVKELAR